VGLFLKAAARIAPGGGFLSQLAAGP